MRPTQEALVCLLVYACACLCAHGVQFELTSTETKCFSEELHLNALVVADYHLVTLNAPKISAKVTTPYGSVAHHAENVEKGEFAFKTLESGSYMACFWMPGGNAHTTATVELDWKTGVAAKDWSTIAKREKLDGIELELRKLEETVEAIHQEMLFLREREQEMRSVNESTNSRMAWFSMTSLCVCLLVAGSQLWYLKTFFERKKLL